MTHDENDATHEIGLVMAGAVSAGAYTAGVVDFLIEAMDAWESARTAGDPLAPPHRVRLKAIAGASAGAMTAGIMAGILAGRAHHPLDDVDPGCDDCGNVFFDSWVNRIDARHLLSTDDLGADHQRVSSLLNGRVLDEIAHMALPDGAGGSPRAWVGDSLDLAFAITNLRGVPYNVGFGDRSDAPDPRPGHSMRKHAELLRFRIGTTDPAPDDDKRPLNWQIGGDGWAMLREAALASGAFPLLLPPRRLARDGDNYDAMLWASPVRADVIGSSRTECIEYRQLSPHWGASGTPTRFDFLAVDGGVLNNEPFAAARDLLAGVPPTSPGGNVLGRSLLSIDPFPDLVAYRPDEPQPKGLLDAALALLNAMKNQTRFKPEELVTAFDDPHANRELIAPSRRVDGIRMDPPLAGGAVDGFAGFIARDFRLHDFWLGRANCQRFFARHFRLPAAHPLFGAWTSRQQAAFDNGSDTLPIVPLLDRASIEIKTPRWPNLPTGELALLEKQLLQRVRALMPQAISHLLARSNPPMRWLTRLLARYQSNGWVRALCDHIERELRRRGQM